MVLKFAPLLVVFCVLLLNLFNHKYDSVSATRLPRRRQVRRYSSVRKYSAIPQKYAEQQYTNPGTKTRIAKTMKRPLPPSFNPVCHLHNEQAYSMCQEICNKQGYRNLYTLQASSIPGICRRYTVKFLYEDRRQQTKVYARRCPSSPPLWVSEGNSKGFAFVYSRISGDILKFRDYVNVDSLSRPPK